MMFVSFTNNTAGVTIAEGTAHPSKIPQLTNCFSGVRVTKYLVFCVVRCG
jgi:hypothetical protein